MARYKFNDWSKSPSQEQWKAFLSKIDRMIREEFGVDADNDPPVNILAIDRTRFEPMHWFPVPYDHMAKTQEDYDSIEEALVFNLGAAVQALRLFHQMKKHRKLAAQKEV